MPSTKSWKNGVMDINKDANAQNSWNPNSSAKASSMEKDPYMDPKTKVQKVLPKVTNAENENSRQSRLGRSQTVSGPKQSPGFLKHTITGKQ